MYCFLSSGTLRAGCTELINRRPQPFPAHARIRHCENRYSTTTTTAPMTRLCLLSGYSTQVLIRGLARRLTGDGLDRRPTKAIPCILRTPNGGSPRQVFRDKRGMHCHCRKRPSYGRFLYLCAAMRCWTKTIFGAGRLRAEQRCPEVTIFLWGNGGRRRFAAFASVPSCAKYRNPSGIGG